MTNALRENKKFDYLIKINKSALPSSSHSECHFVDIGGLNGDAGGSYLEQEGLNTN